MTITLNLPDELVASLKATAESKHVAVDALAQEGIEKVVEKAPPPLNAAERYDEKILERYSPALRDSLGPIWKLLREVNYVPPTDEECERMKEERIMKKYGG